MVENTFGTVCRFAEGMAAVLSPETEAVQVRNQQPVDESEEGGLLCEYAPLLDGYAQAEGAVREDMLVVGGADAAAGLLREGQLVRKRVWDTQFDVEGRGDRLHVGRRRLECDWAGEEGFSLAPADNAEWWVGGGEFRDVLL